MLRIEAEPGFAVSAASKCAEASPWSPSVSAIRPSALCARHSRGVGADRAAQERARLLELPIGEIAQAEALERAAVLRIDLHGARVGARGEGGPVGAFIVEAADRVQQLGVGRVLLGSLDVQPQREVAVAFGAGFGRAGACIRSRFGGQCRRRRRARLLGRRGAARQCREHACQRQCKESSGGAGGQSCCYVRWLASRSLSVTRVGRGSHLLEHGDDAQYCRSDGDDEE